jgi:hypothetical protein
MNLSFLGISASAWVGFVFNFGDLWQFLLIRLSAQIPGKHLSAHPISGSRAITRSAFLRVSAPPWWICLMAHTQKRQPRFELPFLPTKERPQSALEKMEKIIYCTFTFSVSR